MVITNGSSFDLSKIKSISYLSEHPLKLSLYIPEHFACINIQQQNSNVAILYQKYNIAILYQKDSSGY